ncbi:hypothetical protein CK203_022062 [Vitis vinifera]|uniref:Uncharacterized protein n=1 Tax=Vitis vinifera TaxID=29760 RepID=A0A438FZF3_VITVI|nr:hypothetical protein CK203_022062 [Vitis vinifera]
MFRVHWESKKIFVGVPKWEFKGGCITPARSFIAWGLPSYDGKAYSYEKGSLKVVEKKAWSVDSARIFNGKGSLVKSDERKVLGAM